MVPHGLFLFTNFGLWHRGKEFSLNEIVINTIYECFAKFEKTSASDWMKKLETRWIRCIALDKHYCETNVLP